MIKTIKKIRRLEHPLEVCKINSLNVDNVFMSGENKELTCKFATSKIAKGGRHVAFDKQASI